VIIWRFLAKFKEQILKSLLFFAFGILLIFILAQFTDFSKVIKLILATPGRLNFLIFLPLVLYYLLKFLLERFLILKLGLVVTARHIALLFAVAELVREFPTIPILMAASATTRQGEKFFPMRLFSALVPQLPLEIAVCFLILAIFGFGNLPHLRLAAFLAVVLIFVFLVILKKISIPQFLTSSGTGLRGKIAKMLLDLKEGLEQILIWQNLAASFLLILFYFLSLGTAFYFVAQASGFGQLKLTQAWSSFALIYAALVFSPMPADWGVSESSGFILLSFLGASREAALASMLTFRIIFSSATYLTTGVIFWFLRSEIGDFVIGFAKPPKKI